MRQGAQPALAAVATVLAAGAAVKRQWLEKLRRLSANPKTPQVDLARKVNKMGCRDYVGDPKC